MLFFLFLFLLLFLFLVLSTMFALVLVLPVVVVLVLVVVVVVAVAVVGVVVVVVVGVGVGVSCSSRSRSRSHSRSSSCCCCWWGIVCSTPSIHVHHPLINFLKLLAVVPENYGRLTLSSILSHKGADSSSGMLSSSPHVRECSIVPKGICIHYSSIAIFKAWRSKKVNVSIQSIFVIFIYSIWSNCWIYIDLLFQVKSSEFTYLEDHPS